MINSDITLFIGLKFMDRIDFLFNNRMASILHNRVFKMFYMDGVVLESMKKHYVVF